MIHVNQPLDVQIFTFTFNHLTDIFIQSYLQVRLTNKLKLGTHFMQSPMS